MRPEEEEAEFHPPPPAELQIEVTGSCNLSCRMCLVAYRPRLGRSASLSIDDVRRLLDDLPSVRKLTLQGLGEPLLAPDLDAIVAEAVKRGICVGFNTNGTLLTKERGEALIAAGLDWLHVSVDGACSETFASIRTGGHLETVVDNLRHLLEARAAAGGARPRVQLNMVLMRANHAELEALIRMAAELGVDRVWVQALSHDFSDVAGEQAFAAIRQWTEDERLDGGVLHELTTAAAALAHELGLDLRLPEAPTPTRRERGEHGCDWPWRSAYVNHDGTVQPCCMLMGRERGRIGNVHDQPMSVLWQDPQYVDLRRRLAGPFPPPMCRGCALYRHQF